MTQEAMEIDSAPATVDYVGERTLAPNTRVTTDNQKFFMIVQDYDIRYLTQKRSKIDTLNANALRHIIKENDDYLDMAVRCGEYLAEEVETLLCLL